MRSFLSFVFRHLLFWTLYFVVWKCILLAYHRSDEFLAVIWHGLILDLSFAAYLSVLPAIIYCMGWTFNLRLQVPIVAWSVICLLITSVIGGADLELLKVWGNRIDASVLQYLRTPAEAMASMGAAPIPLLVFIGAGTFLLGLVGYRFALAGLHWRRRAFTWLVPIKTAMMLLLTASLIVPIRGGFQQIPINQSRVAFSNEHFLNQLAVNAPWNFFHSLSKGLSENMNPYRQQAPLDAFGFGKHANAKVPKLLKNNRPNVILLIWESLTSKVVERQGGVPGITPNFNRLCKEGIFFSNIYASGPRTDKGLVAILSGYPALPTMSIMNLPQKSQNIPKLPSDMKRMGYSTSFFYGGETEFANMRSYLYQCGYQSVTEKAHFPPALYNSKWGVHDHDLLAHVLAKTPASDSLFFKTILTLSSHEPFDVPYAVGYQENPSFELRDNQFMQAHRYADKAIGDFIEQAKQMPWWDNTLLIIVGDHGSSSPNLGHKVGADPQNYRVPMLWLGGALAKSNITIKQLASQASLPGTLLALLGQDITPYQWESPFYCKPSAVFYTFNEGVGTVGKKGSVVYDYDTDKVIYQQGDTLRLLQRGKAYMHWYYEDYLAR